MTNYKELLENFLSKKVNRQYASYLVKKLWKQRLRKGYYVIKGKIRIHKDQIEDNMCLFLNTLIEKCTNEDRKYDASLIPTIISPDQASNFFIGKETPSKEEVYRIQYLILSGIYRDDYVVNLDNIDNYVRDEFRETLIKEKILIFPSKKEKEGINLSKIREVLDLKIIPPLKEFIYSFIIISLFVNWIKEMAFKNQKLLEEEWDLPFSLKALGIRDDSLLVICNLPKQKKEIYFVPKLNSFISKWYGDYLKGIEEYPFIIKFIFSLYISDKKYRKESLSLLNKFLYYFLNGYVNGELLCDLINLKVDYELKKKRKEVYGFYDTEKFFAKL